MAKIRDANPKQSSGGYLRLVENEQLAGIFMKAQSTVITNGTELEKMISGMANAIDDLDRFIEECDAGNIKNGTYLCTKKVVKKSTYQLKNHEPDFLIFKVDMVRDLCYVVELKDGDAFDTKKATSEKEMLELFVNHIAPKIPFRTKLYICCFNQEDKNVIISGFKQRFSEDEVMTGRELCELLGINYETIVSQRVTDASDNFNYVISELTNIYEVHDKVAEKQRSHIKEDEFYVNEEDDQ